MYPIWIGNHINIDDWTHLFPIFGVRVEIGWSNDGRHRIFACRNLSHPYWVAFSILPRFQSQIINYSSVLLNKMESTKSMKISHAILQFDTLQYEWSVESSWETQKWQVDINKFRDSVVSKNFQVPMIFFDFFSIICTLPNQKNSLCIYFPNFSNIWTKNYAVKWCIGYYSYSILNFKMSLKVLPRASFVSDHWRFRTIIYKFSKFQLWKSKILN